MAQFDIAHSLASPITRIVLGLVGLFLVWMLAVEVRRIPGKLLVLMATAFLDMVGVLMIVPLLPFYVKRMCGDGIGVLGLQLHVGLVTGLVVSAFTVAQSLSAPLWGRFSDRFGRRPALLIALGASTVAYLVFAFADSLWLLLLSRIVQGLGGGTVGVIQAYVADSTEPAQRARALGWLSAATNLGVALGPVLSQAALAAGDTDLLPGPGTLQLGNHGPGLLAALLCVVNMVFAFHHLRESNVTATSHAARPSAWRSAARVIERFTEVPSRLILTYAIAIGAFQGIGAVLALFLNARFQVDEHSVGYFYMYMGAVSVLARVLLLGRLVDRLGEARLSRLGIVLLATGVLGLAFATSLGGLALAVGLLPLGTAFTFPCVTALLSRVVDPQERGLYMGLQQTYGGLARVAAPVFYGWAFDNLGIEVPFYCSAALVLATLLLGFGFTRIAGQARTSAPR